mmetsp:Transcript_63188/g.168290  ORF Transcript_63188/g.168290 Transcript_63188/m.168290 type:complete len:243 (+) Transcript_63188:2660-3388(+)
MAPYSKARCGLHAERDGHAHCARHGCQRWSQILGIVCLHGSGDIDEQCLRVGMCFLAQSSGVECELNVWRIPLCPARCDRQPHPGLKIGVVGHTPACRSGEIIPLHLEREIERTKHVAWLGKYHVHFTGYDEKVTHRSWLDTAAILVGRCPMVASGVGQIRFGTLAGQPAQYCAGDILTSTGGKRCTNPAASLRYRIENGSITAFDAVLNVCAEGEHTAAARHWTERDIAHKDLRGSQEKEY